MLMAGEGAGSSPILAVDWDDADDGGFNILHHLRWILAIPFIILPIACSIYFKKKRQAAMRAQAMNAPPPVQMPASASGAPVPFGVAMAQPAQATQMMMVTCPPGVCSGQAIQVTGANGQPVQLTVPAGISEGQQFQVQMPAAPVAVATAVAVPMA